MPPFHQAELEAYLDEALPVEEMTRIEKAVRDDPSLARHACAVDDGVPHAPGGVAPGFIMRWQGSDLSALPGALTGKLATGRYRRASVGSCPARGGDGSFTAYRLAVLLY